MTKIKLALQTVRDTKGGLGVDYLIASAQASKEYAETQEVDLILVPHYLSSVMTYDFQTDDLANVGKALHDAIEGTQKSIARTYGTGTKMLDTDEIDVQMAFAITWDGKIGGSKIPVLKFLASPTLEHSIKTTNTITVTFARPAKKAP